MSTIAALSHRARAAVLPALLILAAGYFLYHAIGGDRGILAYPGYVAERAALHDEVRALEAQKAALEAKRRLLDPRLNKNRIIDEDYVEELARRDLGLVRPGDLVLKLPPLPSAPPAQ